jgi:tetratricopeptide (TPR) repeat protein
MRTLSFCLLFHMTFIFNALSQSAVLLQPSSGHPLSPGQSLSPGHPLSDSPPIVASPPQPMVADKNRVMDYFRDQEFEEAINYLVPALGRDSSNITVLGYLGYAYYMSDHMSQSEICYRRVLKLDSNDIPALHYLEILDHQDAPEIALEFATRLAVLQPEKSLWWRTRGELFRRLRRPDSALASLSRAYYISPLEPKNAAAMADLLIDNKDLTLADSILDAGLDRDSLNFSLLKLRIRAAYLAKDYVSVLVPGERIMRMNLPDISSQSWLALSYYNLKNYPDCIRACDFLLDAGYALESIFYYKSRALAKLQRFTESNQLLDTCLHLAISAKAEWYFNDIGDNKESTREYRSAIASYDTSYYLFKNPLALYNCGRIAESELKDEVLAKKYYRRYLTVANPQTPEEKKVMTYVRSRLHAKISKP